MMESTPAVPTRAIRGIASMASGPPYLPSRMPRERMRAAVRCAALMPSPMNRMTLRAFRSSAAW